MRITCLTLWIECGTIYSWLWSCCVGSWRFESRRLWHYSRRSFYPTRQLTRLSLSNTSSKFIKNLSPCGEAVNYRPYTSLIFEVAKPRKITDILAIIIIIINLWNKISCHKKHINNGVTTHRRSS